MLTRTSTMLSWRNGTLRLTRVKYVQFYQKYSSIDLWDFFPKNGFYSKLSAKFLIVDVLSSLRLLVILSSTHYLYYNSSIHIIHLIYHNCSFEIKFLQRIGSLYCLISPIINISTIYSLKSNNNKFQFSAAKAAQEMLMSVCLSVCLSGIKHDSNL